jgi:hypothetical protein
MESKRNIENKGEEIHIKIQKIPLDRLEFVIDYKAMSMMGRSRHCNKIDPIDLQ